MGKQARPGRYRTVNKGIAPFDSVHFENLCTLSLEQCGGWSVELNHKHAGEGTIQSNTNGQFDTCKGKVRAPLVCWLGLPTSSHVHRGDMRTWLVSGEQVTAYLCSQYPLKSRHAVWCRLSTTLLKTLISSNCCCCCVVLLASRPANQPTSPFIDTTGQNKPTSFLGLILWEFGLISGSV